MANAKRRKNQRTEDDEFSMPLSDALAQLLPARHITAGARWFFSVVDGEVPQLVIIRSVPTVTIPDPES